MSLKDAEDEARGIWREQKRRKLCLDSNQPQGSHQDGAGQEDQPLGIGGANRSRSDSHCGFGDATVGKILRELIDEIDEQSAYHSSQLKKLSDRRRQLEQLQQELQTQAEEGNDGEPEVD